MSSVASKNLYELLGNDPELDPNREPEPPTKVIDKPVQRAGKRNAGAEGPAKEAPKPAAGGRGGRNAAFTGSEQAFRDKSAGASNNRSKPTDDGVRQDRHPNRLREPGEHRDIGNRGRGSRGGRGFGGRGTRTGRDDRHDRTGHAGTNDHTKQAGAAWGAETGDAEWTDEKAGLADARAEEKEGIVADPTAVDAEGVPAEEEDKTKSYEQYLAEQLEKKAALGGNLEIRKPNEGASKKFPEGKAIARSESEDFIAGSGGKEKKQKERKAKAVLDIDQAWHEEQSSEPRGTGFRGGRGRGGDRPRGGRGRGAPRGNAPRGGAPRGGAASRGGPSPNVTSSSDFPSLGA